VATWSAREGFRLDEEPLAELLKRIERLQHEFLKCMNGDEEPSGDPERGVPHDYFRLLMDLANQEDYDDEAGRAQYAVQREQAKRLRYWARIRIRFGKDYEEPLEKGFMAAHREVPDFTVMTRAGLIRQIALLEAAQVRDVEMSVAEVRATLCLLRGLRDLDSTTIPRTWVE
jgi:hypothetical protein